MISRKGAKTQRFVRGTHHQDWFLGRNQIQFLSRLSLFSWFLSGRSIKRGTTKDTKTIKRKGDPQISLISTEESRLRKWYRGDQW